MMTRTAIRYGEKLLQLEIPGERIAYELKPADPDPVDDPAAELDRALSAPVGTPPLRELVQAGAKIVILGDDATRLTPTHLIVPAVIDELNAGGASDRDITLIIATGTHRAMTDEELEDKYGPAVTGRIKVLNHDCMDRGNLVSCGLTRRGTDIWVNRLVLEADIRIAVGNLVPHHPTGWSGGAKILLPGVAGQYTTGQMHLLGASEQRLGEIDTPCRQEMEDFARETGLDFIINTVLDSKGRVANIVAGHFIEAHRQGVRWGRRVFGAPCPGLSDITLSSTWPVDFDLFQADKGLFSAALTTRPGGEILLLSPCHEGVSPTHAEAVDLARLSDEELLSLARKRPCPCDPLSIAEVLYLNSAKKIARVTLVTEGIDAETARVFNFGHLKPDELSGYLKERLESRPGTSVGLIHNSAETLPVMSVSRPD